MKETKQNLIEKGYKFFLEKGYNATGIQEITDSINVSKGSFYNHFKKKELFASQVLEDFTNTLESEYKDTLLGKRGTPLNRLKEFYERKIDTVVNVTKFKNGCMISNLCQEVSDKSETISSAVDRAFEVMTLPIEKCLEEAQKNGDLTNDKNVSLLAEMILNSWNGALMRVKSSRNPKALDAFRYGLNQLLK